MELPRRPALVIAHRGASALRPEHTFAAWDLALASGADYLELDLQVTADSVLVVLHDETLDRTASGPRPACVGAVAARTLDELRRCEVGAWFDEAYRGAPLPTLDSVLARYGDRARLYIETKAAGDSGAMEEALVAALRRHGLVGGGPERPVIVQSFSAESLRRVAELAPSLPRVQLFRSRESRASIWRRLATVAEYAHGIGPAAGDVGPGLVRAAHALCLEVHPYTVNDRAGMERLLGAGVDGMFTDRPELLVEVLDGHAPDGGPTGAHRRCPVPDRGADPEAMRYDL